MLEKAPVMQSCCTSAVDAAELGSSGFRKVARLRTLVHDPKAWHRGFNSLHFVKIKYTPKLKRLALVAWQASALHSRNIFLLKICQFVVAGAVLTRGHSRLRVHVFFAGLD